MIAFLGISSSLKAWENPGFTWSVGAELNSAYLYRGINYGGLSLQPEASLGYGGLAVTAWGNIGPDNNQFIEFTPELDITLSYSIFGFTVGATHFYYFDESPYFGFKDGSSSQIEAFAEFDLGELVEKLPLRVGWYTLVAGEDWNPITNQRAYSSYLEVEMDFELPLGFYLTPTVGMTPWGSYYTDYEGDFAVNNVSLKAGWCLELGDHFTLDVYAQGMLNTYGITKDNLVTEIKNRYGTQKMNGLIGVGIWLE